MMMQAIVFNEPGGPDVLQLEHRDIPSFTAGQVLIQVKAAGINRPDIFQRKGHYPAPPGVVADIPGLEVAGIIVAVGNGVKRWKPGDQVCALLAGGGYAEYAAAHAGHCLPIPDTLDFAEAATLPETVFTVWHNVFERGKLKKNENFLVQGGSGGIGITAIQLAHLAGAIVYTTAGNPEKCHMCLQLGAKQCINYREENFYEIFKSIGMDVILDSIGATYFEQHLNLLNSDGRLIIINAISGGEVPLNLLKLMSRRLTLGGSTLRIRDDAFKSLLAAQVEKNVWPLIADGRFKTVIHQRLPLNEAAKAHELMERGEHTGKLVLVI